MLDKIKGLGAQVASKANDAVDGISSSVKGGVESLANTATSVTDALNEKAVRTSTARTQGAAALEPACLTHGNREFRDRHA